jgi:hypothetical protein
MSGVSAVSALQCHRFVSPVPTTRFTSLRPHIDGRIDFRKKVAKLLGHPITETEKS